MRTFVIAAVACSIGFLTVACDNRGPVEKAGSKVDETVDTIKHGGHESVGNSIKDDVEKAQDKAKDAVDK